MNTLAAKIAKASKSVGALKADKTNKQQNYDYISADKILERAGDALADVGVVVFPSVTSEETLTVEYVDQYNKPKTRYDCVVHFGMIVSDGESQIELPWIGRGNDYAVPDKAMYKAITSGHKYFLAKLLKIGVGNEDGEHEPAEPAQKRLARAPATPAADDVDSNGDVLFSTDDDLDKLYSHFHALGKELYNGQWDTVRKRNALRVSGGRTDSSKELTPDEVQTLINGMKQVKQTRAAGEGEKP